MSAYFQAGCCLTFLTLSLCYCCLQPDLSQLQLDDKLSAIFGTNQMPAAALPQALGRLLQPLEPVTVTHIIA